MPVNNYLESAVPAFFRRNALDLIIHTWITSIRTVVPSVTIEEAALSCMKNYGIKEEEMSLNTAVGIYHRVTKELIESHRTKHANK